MPAPLLIAHRGACGYRPEHTRSALLLAIEQGAEALEVDVVPTADGALVVRHEPELSGTTDAARRPELADRLRVRVVDGRRRRGWFAEDLTLAEVRTLRARERLPRLRPGSAAHDGREGVLTLGEALGIARAGGVGLVIELKHSARSAALGLPLPALLQEALAAAPALPPVTVESFEHDVLDALAADGLPHPLVALVGHRPLRDHALLADPAALARFAGVSLRTHLARPRVVHPLRERGLDVWAWTLRPENRFLPPHRRAAGPFGRYAAHWRRLADAGLTGVFADHPDLVRTVLGGARAAVGGPA
ncbi:glycerophosphodiester phosphodiesterase family protein [Amnibacterium endophyticum]|uniref:glycerophosphodiester phosphodiesterase n=1 Tax=Amnibacterium endophyticum TaxID=2109337 RepID=A0ABW4LDS7_9MICO